MSCLEVNTQRVYDHVREGELYNHLGKWLDALQDEFIVMNIRISPSRIYSIDPTSRTIALVERLTCLSGEAKVLESTGTASFRMRTTSRCRAARKDGSCSGTESRNEISVSR